MRALFDGDLRGFTINWTQASLETDAMGSCSKDGSGTSSAKTDEWPRRKTIVAFTV